MFPRSYAIVLNFYFSDFYHLTCGIENGSVQVEDGNNSYCFKHDPKNDPKNKAIAESVHQKPFIVYEQEEKQPRKLKGT